MKSILLVLFLVNSASAPRLPSLNEIYASIGEEYVMSEVEDLEECIRQSDTLQEAQVTCALPNSYTTPEALEIASCMFNLPSELNIEEIDRCY